MVIVVDTQKKDIMKLPTENDGKNEEQPVAETGGDGASAEGAASSQQSSTSGSGSSSEGSANNAQGPPNQPGGPAEDFSEYLWMENEEEFDTQVSCGSKFQTHNTSFTSRDI